MVRQSGVLPRMLFFRHSSTQVSMNEEGVVTGCENKKVFEITGFRISGHAHDKQTGAAVKGVLVSLLSQDGHTLNTVETDDNGNYLFENVISGEYTLHADHPSCVLAEPTSQSLSVGLLFASHSQIGFGSVSVTEDFIVSGFKITGIVENKSGKHSLADIGLLLHREDGGAFRSLSSLRASRLRIDGDRLSGAAGSLRCLRVPRRAFRPLQTGTVSSSLPRSVPRWPPARWSGRLSPRSCT